MQCNYNKILRINLLLFKDFKIHLLLDNRLRTNVEVFSRKLRNERRLWRVVVSGGGVDGVGERVIENRNKELFLDRENKRENFFFLFPFSFSEYDGRREFSPLRSSWKRAVKKITHKFFAFDFYLLIIIIFLIQAAIVSVTTNSFIYDLPPFLFTAFLEKILQEKDLNYRLLMNSLYHHRLPFFPLLQVSFYSETL